MCQAVRKLIEVSQADLKDVQIAVDEASKARAPPADARAPLA